MVRFTCIAAIAGLASAAPADEMSVIDRELRIPPQETRTIEFGNVRQQGTTVLLELTARAHYRSLAGSNFFMRLALNGRPVNAARSRRVPRLVNKPAVGRISANAC